MCLERTISVAPPEIDAPYWMLFAVAVHCCALLGSQLLLIPAIHVAYAAVCTSAHSTREHVAQRCCPAAPFSKAFCCLRSASWPGRLIRPAGRPTGRWCRSLRFHCVSTASSLRLRCVFAASSHCLFAASSLPLHTASSLPLRCLFAASSLPFHCLSTAFPLPLHRLLPGRFAGKTAFPFLKSCRRSSGILRKGPGAG